MAPPSPKSAALPSKHFWKIPLGKKTPKRDPISPQNSLYIVPMFVAYPAVY